MSQLQGRPPHPIYLRNRLATAAMAFGHRIRRRTVLQCLCAAGTWAYRLSRGMVLTPRHQHQELYDAGSRHRGYSSCTKVALGWVHVYRRRGKHLAPGWIQQVHPCWGVGVMVWGGKMLWVIINGNLSSHGYRHQVLETSAFQFVSGRPQGTILQHNYQWLGWWRKSFWGIMQVAESCM